jgi:hypothetical protein
MNMGTSLDMVRKDKGLLVTLEGFEGETFSIIAEDEDGLYFTQKRWVGNGLLDPNRDPVRRRPLTSLSDEDIQWAFPPKDEPTEESVEEATAEREAELATS